MNRYEIKEPIWKDNSIGIADFRLHDDLLVDIIYKNKNGDRIFPDTYIIKKNNKKNWSYQMIGGRKIYLMLIKDLEVHNANKN